MLQFLLRRLVFMVPVLIGILAVTFALTRMVPGDACVALLGERYTPARCEEFRARYGLNESLPVQFWRYLIAVLQGDLGDSVRTGRPVTEILSQRLPMTMELKAGAMLFATTLG